ncbi:MAG: restriction endonuclease subunit S [Candidatus Nitrosoglobus sp.]
MSGWRELKLSDFIELCKDQFKPDQNADFNYIGLEHIEQEKLRLNSIGHSSEITSNKFLFKNGDVLFGKLRPYFRKVIKSKFDGVCSTDIWVVRAKKDNSQDFVFYFLANWEFINTANAGEGGSRMPRADWNFLKDTYWSIPKYNEQRAIAAVLSSLDDKIDLLHRQNKTLEAMAETLFRQWFVINAREDWEEKSLLDVIELIGGGTPKTSIPEYWDGEIPWLSGGDIVSSHKSFAIYSERTITQEGLDKSSAKLLPKFATVISARGTVGKYALLSKPMAYSQSNYGISPKIEGCFFFTYLLINHVVNELQSSAYGSVFDTITTATFKDILIAIPPDEVVEEFERNISVYFVKKLHCLTQIRILEKLRDTLLPKLMSGEVRVAL